MDDLLPSLSSDDESNRGALEVANDGDNSSDEDDGGEVINVEFGGILGEDGGVPSSFDTRPQNGWSYQTALDRIERDNLGMPNAPPRMDLASIIAAKRRSLKKNDKDTNNETPSLVGDEKASGWEGEESDSDNEHAADESSDDERKEHGESDESNSDSESSSDDDEVDDVKQDLEQDTLKTRIGDDEKQDEDDPSDSEEEDEEEQQEARKAAQFFDSVTAQQSSQEEIEVFTQLALSRPLLRGIAAMGFVKPTAIQSSVIPIALAGRDICASAVTGSGKTAAFLLPILERLLYRPPGRIRCLILTPTRELAAQCLGMISTLSQFTKISSALVVGGSKNMNAQMAELRARPQIVVATPGRLLDHVTNSAGVSLEDVEFLVLDEADRLLDLGFQDEVTELIKSCPKERQTLLFSATMNTKVDDLIDLSLKRPVRIRVSDKDAQSSSKDLEVAPRLEQEFVRVRSGNEGLSREAMLLALLTRTFTTQTIVFFDTKAKAHRMMILCGLCGIKCAELHGNLTQSQRLEALELFRQGQVDILLATDLAARGLDINRVETVLNFEMPNQISTYIHRIGRTARAGRGGKSCTLIGEGRRHLMKEIMKDASDRKNSSNEKETRANTAEKAIIRSRSIPPAVVAYFVKKIESLEEHVDEVLQAEAVARMDRLAEMEATKAQNIIEHSDEINARPQRQWFASEKQKKMSKEAAAEKTKLIAEKVGTGVHRMTRKKRRAREAKEMFESGDDDDGKPVREKLPSIKKLAREYKRDASKKEKDNLQKSLYDEDVERASKKQKGALSFNSLGDSTLFGEEKITYASKQRAGDDQRVKSAYNFKEFDPTKDGLRKGKKKTHHKFKSKSKYKRR
ncbi:DEAD/DEAH box helicase domain protein [Nitzschia inconspicua]|uniref:DEAD/DEAH box helicase domain protein n=1 Tax=Nitzschia inconspicua TaxID=303405 RepID=A0A9K3LDK7_9STRA|nr:DEAD/DEAH box helicase domain protein [Nitzschia inconspicua]